MVLPILRANSVCETLVGGTNVFKAERHDIVVVDAIVKHEDCFGCVQVIHLNLVVFRGSIHESQYMVTL